MMDYKSNYKYFTQKSPTPMRIFGVLFVAVGVFLFFFRKDIWFLAFGSMFLGAILLVIIQQRHITEKDVDASRPILKRQFQQEFEHAFLRVDQRALHIHAVASSALAEEHSQPIYGGEYLFEDEDFLEAGAEKFVRRGADGKTRSSVYACTGMLIDPKCVRLMKKKCSLLTENAETFSASFRYSELSRAEIERKPSSTGIYSAHHNEMVFYALDGTPLFALPIRDDCDDEYRLDKINHQIEIARKESL